MQALLPLQLALAATLVAVGIWLRPWQGLAFVVVGSVPYYAALHLLGLMPSAALTGGIFGGVGGVAVSSLVLRCKRLPNLKLLVPFLVFVSIWALRWYQDPPAAYGSSEDPFAERSRFFMLAFAAFPFIGALCARDERDLRQALVSLATWGAMAAVIVLAYWLTGQPNTATGKVEKWLPIPYLTGIILSFDIGVGCLAFLSVARRSDRFKIKAAFGWLWVGAAIAIMVRVGQRGPFIFFVMGLAALVMLQARQQRLRALAIAALVLGFVGAIASEVSESYESTRAVATQSYTAEGNSDRILVITEGVGFIAAEPLLGWGGKLVGKPMPSGDRWDYIHVTLLDPLVETGVVGAAPYWYLLAVVASIAWNLRAVPISGPRLAIMLAPLLVYAFMEGQVSGHVSAAKHLWFAMGLVGAVPTLAFRDSRFSGATTAPGAPRGRDPGRLGTRIESTSIDGCA